MALTKKMLSAMEIPTDKIDEIINAHTEVVHALEDERDKAQKEVNDFRTQLDTANAELTKFKSEDWEKKYNAIKSEYDGFKANTEAKAIKSAKESAYKKLLETAGIPTKRIDSIIKISTPIIEALKFDEDGNVENSDKITESIKSEWADFITTTEQRGANVSNPPVNNGGDVKKISRAAELATQYYNEHYGVKED